MLYVDQVARDIYRRKHGFMLHFIKQRRKAWQ